MAKICITLNRRWKGLLIMIFVLICCFLLLRYLRVLAPIPSTNTWPDSHNTLVFYGNVATSPLTLKMALYFFDLDEKRLTYWIPIVASPHNYASISWASQAQQLLFSGSINSVSGLYLVSKNGNIERVEAFDRHSAVDLALSPDAKFIAFVHYREEEIYVYNVAETTQQRLTYNSYFDHDPEWSPDGQELLFRSSRLDEDYSAIIRMNGDGTNQRVLIQNSNNLLSNPIWSPDGNLIAFKELDEQDGYLIWIMNTDGSNAYPVLETNADGDVYDIVWSPDSQHIVFVWSKDGYCGFQVEYQPVCARSLYLLDINTGEVTRLTNKWLLYSDVALAN